MHFKYYIKIVVQTCFFSLKYLGQPVDSTVRRLSELEKYQGFNARWPKIIIACTVGRIVWMVGSGGKFIVDDPPPFSLIKNGFSLQYTLGMFSGFFAKFWKIIK